MADVSELRMNVAALKRVDPYAKEILETATHVALYKFNADENEWEKTEVEGALFVYSRGGEPYHNILIMNRLNTNNLVEPVTQELDLQLKEPFLLYRNARCHIYGIWFYDKDECICIAALMDRLVKQSSITRKLSTRNNVMNNHRLNSTTNVDIFNLLSKAQDNFQSNKSVVSSVNIPEDFEAKQQMPQGVADFFAKASSGSSHFPTEKKVIQPSELFAGHQGSITGSVTVELPQDSRNGEQLKPLLQRLMSNPVHTVEHIEKQQRSVTPQSEVVKRNKGKSHSNKHSGFKMRPLSSNTLLDENLTKPSILPVPSGRRSSSSQTEPSSADGCVGVETDSSFLRISSPTVPGNSTLESLFNAGAETIPNATECTLIEQRPLSAPLCSALETPLKPALMPPTMFTSSASKNFVKLETSTPINVNITPLAKPLDGVSMSNLINNDLINNEVFNDIVPEPLTKKQILQAVYYLLKNDQDFINKLHEAYLKSFAEKVLSSTDGARLVTTDQSNELRVYRAPFWDLETTIIHTHRRFQYLTPIKAAWHPLEDIIVAGRYADANIPQFSKPHIIDMFDAASGNLVYEMSNPEQKGIAVLNKFNSTGDMMASGIGSYILLLSSHLRIGLPNTMNTVPFTLHVLPIVIYET
ncbi:unnamed protein product [Timema podura]|uniref:mRNA-decapping enzyme C-terminal domain-containing protein n=1 Tax=Timema podura TaxID=61482 RepID=A0ABN7NF92_TIMPD|nr:unnamed protein product [Timema podura]